MTDAERIERAERVRRLLDDDDLRDLVTATKERLARDWMTTDEDAIDAREFAYWKIKALDALLHEMRGAVSNGKSTTYRLAAAKQIKPL